MRRALLRVGLPFLLLVIYLVTASSPIEPEAFTPAPARALEGALAPNQLLRVAELVPLGRTSTGANAGPEDLLVEAGPRVTYGTASGQIVEWTPTGSKELANTGGRPLGLARDAQGRLLVADADQGLLRLEPGGKLKALATGADGRPFRFANELAMASDGSIYFSDSSDRWPIKDFCYEVVEGRARGRILKWEPAGAVKVLLDRVHFPNGVALSPDQSVLYFAQTTRYRISKLYLTGPRAGQVETLIDDLPGFPDNISVSPRGTIWVALFSLRDRLLDMVGPVAWARGVVAKLPRALWETPGPYGLAVEVDAAGRILRSLHDPGGQHVREVTTVVEREGTLWLGTLRRPWFARLTLEPASIAAQP